MKFHITFELDLTSVDMGLGDLFAIVQDAAGPFKHAVGILGPCRLLILKTAQGNVSIRGDETTIPSPPPSHPPDTLPALPEEEAEEEDERKPYWRCGECGHVDRAKPMPVDRLVFYSRPESPKCPKCKSIGFVPVGF